MENLVTDESLDETTGKVNGLNGVHEKLNGVSRHECVENLSRTASEVQVFDPGSPQSINSTFEHLSNKTFYDADIDNIWFEKDDLKQWQAPDDLFLAGEFPKYVGEFSHGMIVLSNYRIFVVSKSMDTCSSKLTHDLSSQCNGNTNGQPVKQFLNQSHNIYCVPLTLIDSTEVKDVLSLDIFCKNGLVLKILFSTPEALTHWNSRFLECSLMPARIISCFPFYYKAHTASSDKSSDYSFYDSVYSHKDFLKEVSRLNFDKDQRWKICSANETFQLCLSYPRYHIIPSSVSEDELKESAKYRASSRFPSVVWQSPTGAALARSAQPLVGWGGLFGWRCDADEKLVGALADPVGENKRQKLLIIDARNYTSALGNGTRGGGYERAEYYKDTEIEYLGLPNIHGVRSCFQSFRNVLNVYCRDVEPPNFLSELEKCRWLTLIVTLLKHSSYICDKLVTSGRSVLVHCSDGWDRTPQLVSLTLLLADPYYRTIEGFKTLINREWFEFGHKFYDRYLGKDLNERSPIFLQFLDCVHQLLHQFPTAFEFSECLLRKLALHSFAGFFGSFLCNCPSERDNSDISSLKDNTFCVWNLLKDPRMRNYMFESMESVLVPSLTMKKIRIWSELYCLDTAAFSITRLDWDGLPVFSIPCQERMRMLEDRIIKLSSRELQAPRCSTPDKLENRSKHADSSSGESLDSFEPVDQKDSNLVRWVPDHMVSHCQSCNTAFGLVLTRKHHCRACGFVFCSACSDKYIPLPEQYLQESRVCKNCFKTRAESPRPQLSGSSSELHRMGKDSCGSHSPSSRHPDITVQS